MDNLMELIRILQWHQIRMKIEVKIDPSLTWELALIQEAILFITLLEVLLLIINQTMVTLTDSQPSIHIP